MPFIDPPFTKEELAAIERFIAMVSQRERKIAESTGIAGSFAKAMIDLSREIRAESIRLEHKDRAEKLNEGHD